MPLLDLLRLNTAHAGIQTCARFRHDYVLLVREALFAWLCPGW